MRPVLVLAIFGASLVLARPNETPAFDTRNDQTPGISSRDVDIDQTPAFDSRAVDSDFELDAREPSLPLDEYTIIELEERAAYEATVELEARALDKRAPKTPKTVVIDGARMLSARTKLKNGSASAALKRSYGELKKLADGWYGRGPWSVVDKGKAAPNATTVRDYYSRAPYSWPSKPVTKSNPQGCPWVNRDGQRNPSADYGTDRQNLGKVAYSAPALAFMWFHSGQTKYAQHASRVIRTWFIDSKRGMMPRILFAQAIPCETTGRSIGIIDFAQFHTTILDAVAVLESGTAAETGWTSSDRAAFREWNKRYYAFLTTHAFGIAETGTTNNHGVWADMQRAGVAAFLGWGDSARGILNGVKTKRINPLISGNGGQPKELDRTRSWHYSTFTLVAYARLAQVGAKLGVNLWSYAGPQGQSIFKAANYIIPAATGAARWTHPEMNFTRYAASDVIHAAADAGHGPSKAAVLSGKLARPPKGDLWYVRMAPEQLDSIADERL